MLKSAILWAMMFVGNPDNYALCAILTAFATLILYGVVYRKMNDREREAAKRDFINHLWGLIVVAVVWPVTWVVWSVLLIRSAFFYITSQRNVTNRIREKWVAFKKDREQKRTIKLTKDAIKGKPVTINGYTNNHVVDLEN